MTIRLPVLLFSLFIAALIGAWWLLAGELIKLLTFLHGNQPIIAHIILFVAPVYIVWRLAND